MIGLVLAWLCIGAPPDDAAKVAAVKQHAELLVAATLEGDAAKMVDGTYVSPKLGLSREQFIEALQDANKKLKAAGCVINAYTFGDPSECLSEGNYTFVVIPTTMELTIPNAKVIAKSYSLGISSDDGKTWKFVEGGSLEKHKDQRDKMLPKLPANLKLPAPQKPEIIKDK